MNAMVTADFASPPVTVRFDPLNNFSDPSYVLPLFYSDWACFDTANATFWQEATTYGRTFLQKNVNASTGLASYEANYDGTPYSGGDGSGANFNADAWRVPMNIMADYYLNKADPWQVAYAKTHAAFWTSQGLANYGSGYTLSGTQLAPGHGSGLAGSNAMLAFALDAATAQPFLKAVWDMPVPSGQYRYYDGCLYLLSILHLSGAFNLLY